MIKLCRVLGFLYDVHDCRLMFVANYGWCNQEKIVIALINVCLNLEMFQTYMRLEG